MQEKLQIPIRNDVIKGFLNMCFSANSNIMFKDILSLKKLVDRIDKSYFQNEIDLIPTFYYFELLDFFLNERINKKVNNLGFIKGKLIEESLNREIFSQIIDSLEEISNEDLDLIRKFIAERLRYIHLYENTDSLEKLILDIKTNNYNSLEELSVEYENVIKTHFSELNKTKVNQQDILNDLMLDGVGIQTLSENLHEQLNRKGHILTTGIQELDNIFGGQGVVRGETTLFGGATGNFKSGTLLNVAYNLKLFNPKLETVDPTKKPLIMYVSFENTQLLTYQRSVKLLLNMNKGELKDHPPSEITTRMVNVLNNSEFSDPNAVINLKYFRSGTLDIEDIYALVEEQETEGYEVVALVVDYLKLIKSSNRNEKELRIVMSNISRGLADLGVSKYIAVVSAFQLNRNAITSDKLNLTHVAEAYSITEHADNVAFIRKTYDPNLSAHFLQVFEGKQRSSEETFGANKEESIFIPFTPNNSFRLLPTKFEQNPYLGKKVNVVNPHTGTAENSGRGSSNTIPSNNIGKPIVPPMFNNGSPLNGNSSSFGRG